MPALDNCCMLSQLVKEACRKAVKEYGKHCILTLTDYHIKKVDKTKFRLSGKDWLMALRPDEYDVEFTLVPVITKIERVSCNKEVLYEQSE